jgi:hypothetical protein
VFIEETTVAGESTMTVRCLRNVLLVWKAEQGDAWSYSYLGTNDWLQMSHGRWRDLWFYAYYVGG